MKKILVPTDFSPNADKALNYAVQLAKRSSGELCIVHATATDTNKSEIMNAEEKLDFAKRSISESEVLKVNSKLYHEPVVKAVLSGTTDSGSDLVVIGTLGDAALREKIFGSVSSEIIGKSQVPVLVIPLLYEWKNPSRILVAVKKFEEAEPLMETVFKIAKLFNASVQIAIFTDLDDDFVEDYDEHELDVAAFRDRMKIKYTDVEIHAVHLAGKHFTESLTGWINNNQIDLLVMLTHKRNMVESLFNRSMTRKMSYHSDIPLLAIPVV